MASPSHNRNKIKQVKKEEDTGLIVISSDDEAYQPKVCEPRSVSVGRPRINFAWDWKKEVTPAVADLTKKQTLHVPAWVVRDHLMKMSSVWLKSVDNGRDYACLLFNPPERGLAVRYLGNEWYDYLDDHEPMVGDCLLFDSSSTRNVMRVKLLRAKDRRCRRDSLLVCNEP